MTFHQSLSRQTLLLRESPSTHYIFWTHGFQPHHLVENPRFLATCNTQNGAAEFAFFDQWVPALKRMENVKHYNIYYPTVYKGDFKDVAEEVYRLISIKLWNAPDGSTFSIVAHSMGGLVATFASNKFQEKGLYVFPPKNSLKKKKHSRVKAAPLQSYLVTIDTPWGGISTKARWHLGGTVISFYIFVFIALIILLGMIQFLYHSVCEYVTSCSPSSFSFSSSVIPSISIIIGSILTIFSISYFLGLMESFSKAKSGFLKPVWDGNSKELGQLRNMFIDLRCQKLRIEICCENGLFNPSKEYFIAKKDIQLHNPSIPKSWKSLFQHISFHSFPMGPDLQGWHDCLIDHLTKLVDPNHVPSRRFSTEVPMSPVEAARNRAKREQEAKEAGKTFFFHNHPNASLEDFESFYRSHSNQANH